MLLSVSEPAAYADDEYRTIFLGDCVFSFLWRKVWISLPQFFGVNEQYRIRKHRGYLRIHFADHIFRPDHRRIYAVHCPFQERDCPFFGSDDALPVPLVDIQGMQIVQLFICPYRIHVGVDAVPRLYPVFCKSESLPFCERMYHLRFGFSHILDFEGYRALHSVEVIIDAHPFQHEQGGGHPVQSQFR